MRWFSLLFLSFSLVFTACQTVKPGDFNKIEIGSNKGQVLNILGNPHRKYRKNNTDRWVYKFSTEKNSENGVEKEIWFQNGRVVYRDENTAPTPLKPNPTNEDFEPIN